MTLLSAFLFGVSTGFIVGTLFMRLFGMRGD